MEGKRRCRRGGHVIELKGVITQTQEQREINSQKRAGRQHTEMMSGEISEKYPLVWGSKKSENLSAKLDRHWRNLRWAARTRSRQGGEKLQVSLGFCSSCYGLMLSIGAAREE